MKVEIFQTHDMNRMKENLNEFVAQGGAILKIIQTQSQVPGPDRPVVTVTVLYEPAEAPTHPSEG
jgi:hypothetical protein